MTNLAILTLILTGLTAIASLSIGYSSRGVNLAKRSSALLVLIGCPLALIAFMNALWQQELWSAAITIFCFVLLSTSLVLSGGVHDNVRRAAGNNLSANYPL